MINRKEIICLGELLWDALPDGLFMGGAPLNVSLHLLELGEKSAVASRVGRDRLGEEIVRRLEARDADISLIQEDGQLETGFVEVILDTPGDPQYEIVQPVAWDHIELTDILRQRTKMAWALLYGTLGQRSEVSRATTRALMDLEGPLKVFDMNLRFPHVDRSVIEYSLEAADMLKMNDEELKRLQEWFGLSSEWEKAVEELSEKFSCGIVCLTRGSGGSALYMDGNYTEHKGYRVEVADTVGAGDAFLAAALHGLKREREPEEILSFANGTGAFVASRPGGTPSYSRQEIEALISERA